MKTTISLLLASFVFAALSDDASAQGFDPWVKSKIDAALAARHALLDARRVGENSKGADKQRETPAGDDRSTALVDQSSATDFVSAAVNLATVLPATSQLASSAAPSSAASSGGSQTVTTSVYALAAALNTTAPTNPEFYKNHVAARRVSFTVGTASSDPKKDNTEKAGGVVGAKFLILNGRELYRSDNLAQIDGVEKQLASETLADIALKNRIQQLLFLAIHPDLAVGGVPNEDPFKAFVLSALSEQTFPKTLAAAGADALKRIDAEILARLDAFAALQQKIDDAYDHIRGALQVALVYTGTLRPESGYDRHRAELALDYGFTTRLNWTLNGSVDYLNKKSEKGLTSGRIATNFTGDVTRTSDARRRLPVRLSFSGQVAWASAQPTSKEYQATLTVPLSDGIDLPIVYRFSNATSQTAGGKEAKLGLTVDLGRLIQSAK